MSISSDVSPCPCPGPLKKSPCKVLAIHFFKQKTAYEIRLSLVGSEMCIRDSCSLDRAYPSSLTVPRQIFVTNFNTLKGSLQRRYFSTINAVRDDTRMIHTLDIDIRQWCWQRLECQGPGQGQGLVSYLSDKTNGCTVYSSCAGNIYWIRKKTYQNQTHCHCQFSRL